MLYSVRVRDRVFHTTANSQIEAIKKVRNLIKDERLSPMTYKKLKELGYTSNTWKNLTQEQANKIVQKSQTNNNPYAKESNNTKSNHAMRAGGGSNGGNGNNYTDAEYIRSKHPYTPSEVQKKVIDKYAKLQKSQEAKTTMNNIKAGKRYTTEQLRDSAYLKQQDLLIDDYTDTFTDTVDTYSPERLSLQKDIRNTINSYGSYNPKTGKYDGPIAKNRKVVLVTGLPASGKSSKVVNKVSPELQAYVVDSDEVKFLFPEFTESKGLAGNAIHEESKAIIESVFSDKLDSGTNMVIPVVGEDLDKLNKKWLSRLNDAGYDIEIKYQDVDSNESINRVILRAIEQNRPIPSTKVFGYADKPKQVFEKLKGLKGANGKLYVR